MLDPHNMSQLQLISEAVTMTARQQTLEEQLQCHGLRDGGHSTAEYHHPVFMLLYVINNMFRYMYEKNGVTRDIIVIVIST